MQLATCAHCFDGYDIELAKQYFGCNPGFEKTFSVVEDLWEKANKYPETEIRSLAYVKDECKKLIDQIEKE